MCSNRSESDVYGQAASNLVAGSNLEGTIQQILDMGGGTWDRDTVVRALRAAYNNPERAVEYLYSVSFFTSSFCDIFQLGNYFRLASLLLFCSYISVLSTSLKSWIMGCILLIFPLGCD